MTYIIIEPIYSHVMRVGKEFPAVNMRSFKFRTGIDKLLVLKLKHLSTKFCLKK